MNVLSTAKSGMIFLYDGSFDGLLSALAAAVDVPDGDLTVAPERNWQPSLLEDVCRVGTKPKVAEGFLERVRREVSGEATRHLLHVWCSEQPGIESVLLEYARLAFRHGAAVDGYHTHPAVREIERVVRRVTCEAHRLKGLLRFRRMPDGSFYAPLAPDANVALLVGWHFQHRLGAERWVIHDVKRNLGVFWDRQRLEVAEVVAGTPSAVALEAETPPPGVFHREEILYQQLWRQYFEVIAIPERTNPDLQRKCMPRRYWAYLIEKPRRRQAARTGEPAARPAAGGVAE